MKGKGRKYNEPKVAARDIRPSPASGSSLIYGVLPVLEALRAENRRIDQVLIAEGVRENRLVQIIDLCRARSVIYTRVPRDTFVRHLGPEANHQGVIAFSSAADYADLDDVLNNAADPPLFVLLDGVEDPRNLGAILRTAECAGADGIIIPERRAVGLTDTVAKASAGAVEFIRVAKAQNLNNVIHTLKEKNVWVVGTSADAPTAYTEWDWTRPSALVLGGEGNGLHRLVAQNCDVLVKIPMYGKIDSLNVSVAAGVILFEARRQRSRRS
jgi:23S rRNA (guanosine2251-2'-O)-methyltransferase